MVDFGSITIHRMKDSASPTNESPDDLARYKSIAVMPGVRLGSEITFKKDCEVSVCEGGTLEIGDHSFFHSKVWLLLTKPNPQVRIGQWVFIGRDTIVASKNIVTIGDYTIFAPRCYVVDHDHGFEADDLILNQRSELKEVHIGRDCYFGTGTTILGGVTVEDGSVVGAGSVVTKDIPAYQFWAGNPARFIKHRT